MSGRHFAGSTKVLGRDEEEKKPPECAVVASAAAFMGPEWRRAPAVYLSSMMAAGTAGVGTGSALAPPRLGPMKAPAEATPAYTADVLPDPFVARTFVDPAWAPQKRGMLG